MTIKKINLSKSFSIQAVDYANQGNSMIGIRGSGKTYGAGVVAEQLLDAGIPIIVFDPTGVWQNLRNGVDGNPGYQVVVAGGMFADLPLTEANAVEIVDAALKAGVSLVLDLKGMSTSNKSSWMRIVSSSVEFLMGHNHLYGLRHVFIEEAAEFVPQKPNPGGQLVYSRIESLARMGRNMDEETGNFTHKANAEITPPPIKKARIIIVDECSMINEESHRLIMNEKHKSAKVIYLGDIRQLPPIREAGSEYTDKPSPVFFGSNYAILTERIRQGEESPILPFADYFGDNSRKAYPILNPVPALARESIVTEKGALVFANNIYEVIEAALPLYRYAIEHKDMNIIKTVTYRNKTRISVNEFVRECLFGKKVASQEYVEGELLIFHDNYALPDAEESISSSYEIQINKAVQKQKEYKLWELDFIYEGSPKTIEVLDRSELARHKNAVSEKFRYAKSLPYGPERSAALSEAWELKQRYAPVEYGYAITSHKSQGSTYNTVIVDEKDIISVSLTSNKSKSQSIYTALTRAAVSCIVIDGHPTDATLNTAIELSMNKTTPLNSINKS